MFKNKLSQVNLDRLSSENKNLKAKINEMRYKRKKKTN